ncbi:MAG TPA: lipoate--protein ligase family protein [Desulfotomaculum sp.]|nr:MAG: hypothetical protein VR67_08080 [Peptococcaceae bacterium BRH_c8a]KJS78633.1 MAG: hypothetical protein JL56_01000 [Desulfotomaculum sp. BICA1-6]HBX22113.1 lipoate--protein ligase family protein [Desulfotomaculum sp.]
MTGSERGKVWRLIIQDAQEPQTNMAVDEALLAEQSGANSTPTLRFYRWSPPAVSLGYFQQEDGLDQKALDELGIVTVKRITGGRAVLHWGDLTYSVTARAGRDMPASLAESYRYICRGLLAGLALLGVNASFGEEKYGAPFPASCFALATPGDITWCGRKIIGSAQKRIGAALLQHGSILLKPQGDLLAKIFAGTEAELLKCKVTSLEEILARPVTAEEVQEAIIAGFEQELDITFVRVDNRVALSDE